MVIFRCLQKFFHCWCNVQDFHITFKGQPGGTSLLHLKYLSKGQVPTDTQRPFNKMNNPPPQTAWGIAMWPTGCSTTVCLQSNKTCFALLTNIKVIHHSVNTSPELVFFLTENTTKPFCHTLFGFYLHTYVADGWWIKHTILFLLPLLFHLMKWKTPWITCDGVEQSLRTFYTHKTSENTNNCHDRPQWVWSTPCVSDKSTEGPCVCISVWVFLCVY